jgi:NifU-like protein involved in Fe-S cluster formation
MAVSRQRKKRPSKTIPVRTACIGRALSGVCGDILECTVREDDCGDAVIAIAFRTIDGGW